MKKLIVSGVAALSFLSFGIVAAQGTCTSVSPTLSIGSRGSQVYSLQNFLVAQGYPGGGSWMVTGYYGKATAAALRIFQGNHGLVQTGIVDSLTASAISNASCGTSPISYPYVQPQTYQYPYQYQYGTNAAPTLTSMSQNTGFPGNSVTLYGTNFDSVNTVYFGNIPVTGVSSGNGTSLTFTVPNYGIASYSYAGTPLQIYVINSRGMSNQLGFTLYGGGDSNCGIYPYNIYGYNSSCTCGFGYNCTPSNVLSIASLSPSSGGVGTSVTIYGSGFSTTGNTVHFGTGIIANLNSPDGRSVSFIVPSDLTGYGSQPVTLSTYNVSVTNANGASTGYLPFTVTSLAQSGAPIITSVTGPTTLSTNSQGQWSVTISNPASVYASVSVKWGDLNGNMVGTAAPQLVLNNGVQTLTFSHTYYTSGTYTITFTASNSYGLSNTYSTTINVTGNGTVNGVSLSYLSPNAGRTGTQLIITGSGFTTDNTIRFGIGGQQHVSSTNGSMINYTIPQYVTSCDTTSGTYCAMGAQLVTSGVYPITVMNVNGTSNTLYFNVTQ